MGIFDRLNELTRPRAEMKREEEERDREYGFGTHARAMQDPPERRRSAIIASSVGHRLGRGLGYEASHLRHPPRKHERKRGRKRRHRHHKRRSRRGSAPFNLGWVFGV